MENVIQMMKQYAQVILNVKDKRHVSTDIIVSYASMATLDVRIHYSKVVAMFTIQNNSAHDHNTRSRT